MRNAACAAACYEARGLAAQPCVKRAALLCAPQESLRDLAQRRAALSSPGGPAEAQQQQQEEEDGGDLLMEEDGGDLLMRV
jgi:hypothetical protein